MSRGGEEQRGGGAEAADVRMCGCADVRRTRKVGSDRPQAKGEGRRASRERRSAEADERMSG